MAAAGGNSRVEAARVDDFDASARRAVAQTIARGCWIFLFMWLRVDGRSAGAWRRIARAMLLAADFFQSLKAHSHPAWMNRAWRAGGRV